MPKPSDTIRPPTYLRDGLRIAPVARAFGEDFTRLPYLLRILVENQVRLCDNEGELEEALAAFRAWLSIGTSTAEIAFRPGRVLMHDTTCTPALVDVAGMRDAIAEAGGDPASLSPVLTVDVSVDHSVAVDRFGEPGALGHNIAREYQRNGERYRFLKWATRALKGVRVHPPGSGIMHTINLERLATVVGTVEHDGETWAVPDTLIGTDSHTPMINGIGVLAWGVGGLEAESVMFGMPVMMRIPDVIGVRLSNALRDGVLATDLALNVTQRLRQRGIAGEFVEFFGPGVSTLSAGERAVVANMAPEYGASSGYFPVDRQVLAYLAATGRTPEHIALIEAYAKAQQLWFEPETEPRYTEVIEIDLAKIELSLAGPRRPQDRVSPAEIPATLAAFPQPGQPSATLPRYPVAIAAITSCTNTSDPRLTIAAGLLARKARALGLKPPAWVKTSLAPGSPAAERYLGRAGLLDDLEALGFGIVGYGCTTCIGNAGPLVPEMAEAAGKSVLPVAVLSGNRNFPGRVHQQVDAGFLASPPLVVAYALAGDADRDIATDPLATLADGREVRLADLWPDGAEIDAALALSADAADYDAAYGEAAASAIWAKLDAPATAQFPWNPASTYLRRPPFAAAGQETRLGRYLAHPLLVLGDDITTDHISPAGQTPLRSEAGEWLVAHGEDPADLNVYASRRGNWEVMLRGLFTNRTVVNALGKDIPPGRTIHAPSGQVLPLWQAAERYRQDGQSTVVVAGERYGTGSSRDWAAKGLGLLGVRAVLAVSFERIHRSNLVGMGILPLQLGRGIDWVSLQLQSGDRIEIDAEPAQLQPRCAIPVAILRRSGERQRIEAHAAVETALECETLAKGGIIPLILARHLAETTRGRTGRVAV
ncbi:aconitate hydratase AcnA [Bosea caraganae]|uniref:Aconitate hydratase n=1 Tax=Bosea caraganae TaxID=2763117 RepID=A0A370L2E7_9HYPH|nr:aconitate hydratase AcnA [Bosea caraganae]RDJ22211.1 aconitate hydratase AcnA [Bosea caraganae]RDJ22702.1 aconitate hydratase AcnA [Bosea caraganae]